MLDRDHYAVAGVTREPIVFGEYIMGNLYLLPCSSFSYIFSPPLPLSLETGRYYLPNAKGPLPAIIYINPYSYYGPADGYGVQGPIDICYLMAQKGFMVMAFDKMGFSYRY
jgi:hypothetical protein